MKTNHIQRTLTLALCASLGLAGNAFADSFRDATAVFKKPENINIEDKTYIGPFAVFVAGAKPENFITIGEGSNVQDNCTINASKGSVELGHGVIVAHGASVLGAKYMETSIGVYGPGNPDDPNTTENEATENCFVSFNAVVEGAIIEKGSIVSALARVGPYVYLKSGLKVLPGKNITRQSEIAAKTVPVTEADVLFMEGVIEVNEAFAENWALVTADNPSDGLGIGPDPDTEFNPGYQEPTLAEIPTIDPTFRGRRIIGAVDMQDTLPRLKKVMGIGSSLRADEGEPFFVGNIKVMGKNVTFHALEHTHIDMGPNGNYGVRSIVHGGPTTFGDSHGFSSTNFTVSGANFKLGAGSVFFRSRAGANVTVGKRSVVQQSDLPDGTIIPDKVIWLGDAKFGDVEW